MFAVIIVIVGYVGVVGIVVVVLDLVLVVVKQSPERYQSSHTCKSE